MNTKHLINCSLKTIFDQIRLKQKKIPEITRNFDAHCYYQDMLNRLTQEFKLFVQNYKYQLEKTEDGILRVDPCVMPNVMNDMYSEIRVIIDDYKLDVEEKNIFENFSEESDIII